MDVLDGRVKKMLRNLFQKERKDSLYIIAGLGNPEKKYVNTRHNVGFDAIDALAEKYDIDVSMRKHRAFCGKGVINGHKVVLVKPQTYMNLSGESLRAVMEYYKVNPETGLVVLYDDISLDLGRIRIREKGSAGGHNGIKNIIANLNTQNFTRIKIGVGEKPKGMDLAAYVLGHFAKAERETINKAIDDAVEALGDILDQNTQAAMNRFN